MREELYQEPIYKNQKTLCFDIQNILLTKVTLQDIAQCMIVRQDMFDENFDQDYILVRNLPDDPNFEEKVQPF